MRISDWSSDVCSSDLAATETIDRKLIDRMDFRRRWLPGPAAEVDRRNARAAGFWQQVHAQVALAEQLPVEYLEHAIEQRLGKALRSEEHTSELQSLMRISYAVFCLKKKKKTNREQNNNRA